MEKSTSSLRKQIEQTPRNSRGRRMYQKDLRVSICEIASRRRAQGEVVTTIASSLNISASMLSEWMRRSSAVREVAIEESEQSSKQSSESHLSIQLQHGALIEGLSLQDIAYLLGAAK